MHTTVGCVSAGYPLFQNKFKKITIKLSKKDLIFQIDKMHIKKYIKYLPQKTKTFCGPEN